MAIHCDDMGEQMTVDNQTNDTGTQELREAIIKSLDSFGFQGAKRKCYTPKHGKDAYIIEEWSAETLATFIVDDLLAWHTSKVEEARQERLLEWLGEQDLLDVQKFFGMIVYRYMMQPTNADKVTVTLENFGTKDKVLGDMKISAALQGDKES